MNGKQLVDYGITALIVYLAYKILSPLISWIIYIIPTVAVICIIIGCVKMYTEKSKGE